MTAALRSDQRRDDCFSTKYDSQRTSWYNESRSRRESHLGDRERKHSRDRSPHRRSRVDSSRHKENKMPKTNVQDKDRLERQRRGEEKTQRMETSKSPPKRHRSPKKNRELRESKENCVHSSDNEKAKKNVDKSATNDAEFDEYEELCFSTATTSENGGGLDLAKLGARSEMRMRKHKLVPLPDSDTFYFEQQKERYYANMHKLIVTARSQIQGLEQKIELLNKRLESHSTLQCPKCEHRFTTEPHRLLPKYLRVMQSTNRVEMQFESFEVLKDWLLAYNLDRDAKGIPSFATDTKPTQFLTLKDVKSRLVENIEGKSK